MRQFITVSLVVVVALSAAACKKKLPKAGDACETEGSFVCIDPKTRLACVSGAYAVDHCESCIQERKSGFGTSSAMDSFIACQPGGDGPEGSACPRESFDCSDAKTEVACLDGKFRHFSCGGPSGCAHDLTGVTCDHSIANLGDACRKGAACGTDKKTYLRCVDGKFAKEVSCGGPKGCSSANETIDCDEPVATPGDTCFEGTGGCSADGHDFIVCEKGKYVIARRCRGKDARCGTVKGLTNCVDPTVLQAGDPCLEGVHACSVDGRAMLECKNSVLVVQTKCRSCKGNDPVPNEITCHN